MSEWSDTLKACKPHGSEATDTPWAQPAVQCRVITRALPQPKGKAQGSSAGHVAAFQKADLNKEKASEGASSCALVPCSTAPGVSKLWELSKTFALAPEGTDRACELQSPQLFWS